MRHPAPQRLRRHVDELDLVGGPDDRVGDRLVLLDPGDRLDHVVHRLEVLHVDGADDLDAGFEQLLDVLPPLLVARARHVGVRELVDERDLGLAGEDRVDVHLLERHVAVGELPAGDDLEVVQLGRGVGATVRLDEADHDVGRAALVPAPALVEHGERLAHPGSRPQVDPQPAPGHRRSLR